MWEIEGIRSRANQGQDQWSDSLHSIMAGVNKAVM